MTNYSEDLKMMIKEVAQVLDKQTLSEIVFVGGCTTVLFLTDDITKESIRHTYDVDLIIDIMTGVAWDSFQADLRRKGFTDPIEDEDAPNCRMKLGELRVDFMPINPQILGFSNRWYSEALSTAREYELTEDIKIKILSPPLFIATKFEAYLGRGNDDVLESKDIEDIINVVDGREELIDEIRDASPEIVRYIAEQTHKLLNDSYLSHAIASQTRNTAGRDHVLYERLETIEGLA